MSLWNPLHRALVAAAGISVLAAVYAVEVWGQDLQGQTGQGMAVSLWPPPVGRVRPPTVSVATLRVPLTAWKHFDRAARAAERHRSEEFEHESAKALKIAPEFAQMYMLRATVEVNAHQFEAGIASVQAALRFDPGTVWAAVVLAGAYNGMRRFHDALLVLNAQRGREAASWQAMYELSRAEIGTEETVAALHWSGLMLQSAPREFADAHLVRANALLLAERWSEAAGQLTVYLDSRGPQPQRAQALALREAAGLRAGAWEQIAPRQTLESGETAVR